MRTMIIQCLRIELYSYSFSQLCYIKESNDPVFNNIYSVLSFKKLVCQYLSILRVFMVHIQINEKLKKYQQSLRFF